MEETQDMLMKADAIAKRIEEANKKTEELLIRQESLAARQLLGGKTDNAPAEKKPEKTPVQYAQDALKGIV